MAFFKFLWLRRFVRRNTKPIEVNRAALWKGRLSVVYMLLAWNGFGLVCYMLYTGKGDWAKYYGLKSEEEMKMSPGKQWAKTLGVTNATIYRVSGLQVTTEDYEVPENETQQTNNINT